MYNKVDIIITLSQYLIRPQQRRIFAILYTKDINDIIAHSAGKRIAEYCNNLRQFRDIHGKLVNIRHRKLKYYDICGYRNNSIYYNIYKFYSRYDNIYQISSRSIKIHILIENKNNTISIYTNRYLSKIVHYMDNDIVYEWNNNRELIETRIYYNNYDILYINYTYKNIRIDLLYNNKVYNLL